jgi:putative oxidoreductase
MFPALAKTYPQGTEWAYLLLRLTAGLMLLAHVWPKLMAGPAAVAANVMTRRGVEPALAAAYVVCITLGLFTRAVALLLVLEFIVIVKTHLTMQGWGGPGGAEYPFLWFVVYIFIMMRGGGKYSVDAMLGKEI